MMKKRIAVVELEIRSTRGTIQIQLASNMYVNISGFSENVCGGRGGSEIWFRIRCNSYNLAIRECYFCWSTCIGYTFGHQMAPLALMWMGEGWVVCTGCQLCLLHVCLFRKVFDVDAGDGVDIDGVEALILVQLVGHLLLCLLLRLSVEISFTMLSANLWRYESASSKSLW